MTTVHLTPAGRVAYVKGAAEILLPRTSLPAPERARAVAAAAAMERDALRVLAFARRILPEGSGDSAEELEQDLELLGLVGMLDPPRPEVADAVARCRRAGIRVIMVTGDSALTAEAIGRRIALVGDDVHVITGSDLADMDDDELRGHQRERDVVFARINPEQKLRLAGVLREDGEVVAMTGDGVNDAPALQRGRHRARHGTDRNRGGEGERPTWSSSTTTSPRSSPPSRKDGPCTRTSAASPATTSARTSASSCPSSSGALSGGAIPLPLVVMQVLAIDLGTDMLPAIALGTERAEPGR